jgi:hypothetical protein
MKVYVDMFHFSCLYKLTCLYVRMYLCIPGGGEEKQELKSLSGGDRLPIGNGQVDDMQGQVLSFIISCTIHLEPCKVL